MPRHTLYAAMPHGRGGDAARQAETLWRQCRVWNRLFVCLNKLVCFPVMFQSVSKHILSWFSPEFLWSPKIVSWVPALEHAKNKLFSPDFLWSHECESWVPALEHAKNRNCLNKKWMHEKRFGDSKNTRRKHEFGNTQSTKLNIKLKRRKVKFQQQKNAKSIFNIKSKQQATTLSQFPT